MPGRHFDTGRDALDFIDGLGRLGSVDAIVTSLRDKLASYGFHAFLITGLPDIGDRIDPLVMLNGWPPGWFDLYVKQSFSDHDPIVAHCKRSIDPFAWADVYRDDTAKPREREVMQRARDFTMIDGFCVPIHDENGFRAVVTMAGDRPDLSPRSLSAIHLMSIYAHNTASSRGVAAESDRPLTIREREVLTWMAIGRTTEGVAERLGISSGTVEAHYENAARKLGVRGRVRTLIEAHRRGQITL